MSSQSELCPYCQGLIMVEIEGVSDYEMDCPHCKNEVTIVIWFEYQLAIQKPEV